MFTCKPKIKFIFTSSFRYYILKNPAVSLTDSILSQQSFARYDIGVEIIITKFVFTLDYFQEKLMTNFSTNPNKN